MILNKQKKVRLATRPLREFLRRTQRELNIANSEITIAFVSDAEISQWNEKYRGKSGPTDVLSFPATSGVTHTSFAKTDAATSGARRNPARTRNSFRPNGGAAKPKRDPEILGDIAIAPETAQRYAKKNGRSLAAEIRVLMLHGALHLMGYDHESDTGQMNRIEQKLRRRLGIV